MTAMLLGLQGLRLDDLACFMREEAEKMGNRLWWRTEAEVGDGAGDGWSDGDGGDAGKEPRKVPRP